MTGLKKLSIGFTLSNGASQGLILPPLQCKQPYLVTSCLVTTKLMGPKWKEKLQLTKLVINEVEAAQRQTNY